MLKMMAQLIQKLNSSLQNKLAGADGDEQLSCLVGYFLDPKWLRANGRNRLGVERLHVHLHDFMLDPAR